MKLIGLNLIINNILSTDIYNHKSKIQNTDVIGWNPKLLLKYSIIDPLYP